MSIPVDRRSEDLLMSNNPTGKKRTGRLTLPPIYVNRIDVLPDDVLLEAFDFYVMMSCPSYGGKKQIEAWQVLVHVSRRWRNLVFGSPLRLDLRLFCTPETPARDTLDVWPALPLIVESETDFSSGTNNIITALEQSNRVIFVGLKIHGWQLEEVLAPMQVSFPKLTGLRLISFSETVPVIPDSFLDGSAPRLRHVYLEGISFPGLPKLLLSATHLTSLSLYYIPHSGYISPEAMVALISVLSRLDSLTLQFQSPQSRPDWEGRSLPPYKRSILPYLNKFYFDGVTEYLEEIVTRIDTPQLDEMSIRLFNQIDFDCRRLAQFINHTPKLREFDRAYVDFHDLTVTMSLRYPWKSDCDVTENLWIGIPCGESDWQLSSIEQVCNSSLDPLSAVEELYIERRYSKLVWKEDAIESFLWLRLLLPFTAVKNLYLSKDFAPGIAVGLQDLVGGRITEVLPSLQNIFVEALEPSGPFHENIAQFIAARQLSDHPVVILPGTDSST